MTAPRANIAFNNSTGSDTAASGLGPATAVTGTGGSVSGTTTVDLSADSPDLSGVQAGDLLYVNTSGTNRKFSIIASVDNTAKTVTCDDTFSSTPGSGRTWAIGGKRSTLDETNSRRMLTADGKGDWVLDLEHTGTDYTISSTITTVTGSDGITVTSSSGTRPTLNCTANTPAFATSANFRLKNVHAKNTNATKTASCLIRKDSSNDYVYVENVSTDTTDNFWRGCHVTVAAAGNLFAVNCSFSGCANVGIQWDAAVSLFGCRVENNGSHGIVSAAATIASVEAHHCIIAGNGGEGIDHDGNAGMTLELSGCVIHGNTGDGVDNANTRRGHVFNCQITGNGGFGLLLSGWDNLMGWNDYNNYGTGATANTSGATSGVSQGPNSTNVDPQYTSAGTGDFSTGANAKAAGFPDSGATIGAGQSNTTAYVDIGIQQEAPAASGGQSARNVMIGSGINA